MHVAIACLIIGFLLSGFHTVQESPEGEVFLYIDPAHQVEVRQIVKPSSEIQFERVIKQAHDFSCGSAALATFLNYDLGEELSERQVIRGMLQYGDSEKIRKRRAFSLLDMKKFVSVLGYKGVGYKAEIEDLKTLGHPCILPIKIFEYRHFVVFKGIYEGHIFLADPWQGNISFTLPEFQNMWYQNVILVISPEGAKELNALQLRDEDLRFIDEETTREILFDDTPFFTPTDAEFKMRLVPKIDEYYKGYGR
jgi:predicted double-glycine peptidase